MGIGRGWTWSGLVAVQLTSSLAADWRSREVRKQTSELACLAPEGGREGFPLMACHHARGACLRQGTRAADWADASLAHPLVETDRRPRKRGWRYCPVSLHRPAATQSSLTTTPPAHPVLSFPSNPMLCISHSPNPHQPPRMPTVFPPLAPPMPVDIQLNLRHLTLQCSPPSNILARIDLTLVPSLINRIHHPAWTLAIPSAPFVLVANH